MIFAIIKLIMDSYVQLLRNLFINHEEFLITVHINDITVLSSLAHIITMSPGSIAYEYQYNLLKIHCLGFALVGTQEFIYKYCSSYHYNVQVNDLQIYKL